MISMGMAHYHNINIFIIKRYHLSQLTQHLIIWSTINQYLSPTWSLDKNTIALPNVEEIYFEQPVLITCDAVSRNSKNGKT